VEEAAPETVAKLEELREHLRRDSLGGLFEDKDNGAVMHWRGEPPRKAKQIEQRARALFEPLARMDGLMLLEFESGLELRTGRDKGGAVKAILEEERSNGIDGPVAFLGDDLTDETAFAAVNEQRGAHLSALVRSEPRTTQAGVWLKPPSELRAFLRRWVEAAPGR
jgi:trehalose 6-phosphate phosphatase